MCVGPVCCQSRNGSCRDTEPASLGTNHLPTGKKLLNLVESFPSFDMQDLEKLSFSFGEEVNRVLAHAYDRQADRVCLHPATRNQLAAGPCSEGLESSSLPLYTPLYIHMLEKIKILRKDSKGWAKEKLCVWQNHSPTKQGNSNGIINYKQISSAYMSVFSCGPFSERIIACLCFNTW